MPKTTSHFLHACCGQTCRQRTRPRLTFIAGILLTVISAGAASQVDHLPTASPTSEHGAAELVRVADGIPVHRVTIPTFAHDDVDMLIDGELDEPIWAELEPLDNMLVVIPPTGQPGRYPTEVRMFATERGLYVGAIMYQPPETLVLRRSARNQQLDRDTFGITLDTAGTGRFAYWFNIALGNSVMDGKVLAERSYSTDWDGPWISRTAARADGWSAEVFFPWSMMNLTPSPGSRTVGFAVSRRVAHENALYQWPGHPYTSAQFVSALNQMAVADVQPRPERSFIPFAAVAVDEWRNENELRVGADFAWKPSPAVEVAGALLPDFGAVEADDVVLNLTAQETFFPEKRLFFLEGSEIFETNRRASSSYQLRLTTNENYATASRRVFMNSHMPAPIALFNTRRIGGTPTQVVVPPGVTPLRGEFALPTDVLGAVKATGSGGGYRYGILAAAEDDLSLIGHDSAGNRTRIRADGREFGALRLVHERTDGSRRAVGYLGTVVRGPLFDAYLHGMDARYGSADGRWVAEGVAIASSRGGEQGRAMMLDLQYARDSRLQHRVTLDRFDERVNFNDLGFLQRNDYTGAQYNLLYARPSAAGGRVTDIRGTVIVGSKISVSDNHFVDGGVFWRNTMLLPGRNTLRTGVGYLPSSHEDRDSRGNGAYRRDDRIWSEILLATDASGPLSFSFNLGAEQENLGDWTHLIGGGLTWRPTDGMSLDLDVRYRNRNGWIVYRGGRNFGRYDAGDLQPRLRFNWFATAAHQVGFTFQWVGVRATERGFFAIPDGDGRLIPATRRLPNHDFTVSMFTMQARYRWEIAPLTDLYIVYNRGSTLPNQIDASYSSLLNDALRDPIIDSFMAKLRWRFAN
jgi:hypothetical protein